LIDHDLAERSTLSTHRPRRSQSSSCAGDGSELIRRKPDPPPPIPPPAKGSTLIRKGFFFILCIGLAAVLLPASVAAAGYYYGSAGFTGLVSGSGDEGTGTDIYSDLLFRINDGSGVSFNLSGRLKAPLYQGPDTDFRLYSALLEWEPGCCGTRIAAGRRFLYRGVIQGYRDGVFLDLDLFRRPAGPRVTVFAGEEAGNHLDVAPLDGEDGFEVGVAVDAGFFDSLDILLSARFGLERQDSPPDVAGLLLWWTGGQSISADCGFDYGLSRRRMEKSHARLSLALTHVSMSAEYFRRESYWIPKSSWYSYFADLLEPCSQVRISLSTGEPVFGWLSAGTYWVSRDFEENSVSAHLTAWNTATIGYRFSGDGDQSKNGVFGSFRKDISGFFRVAAGADLSRYKVYDMYDRPAYGSYLRAVFDPGDAFSLFSEAQFRKNSGNESDIRILLGGRYRLRGSYGTGGP